MTTQKEAVIASFITPDTFHFGHNFMNNLLWPSLAVCALGQLRGVTRGMISLQLIRMNRMNNWMRKMIEGIGRNNEGQQERVLHLKTYSTCRKESSTAMITAHLPRPLWKKSQGSGVIVFSYSSPRGTYLISSDLQVFSFRKKHHLTMQRCFLTACKLILCFFVVFVTKAVTSR